MKQFALLGEPLGHSMSPALHKAIYRQLEIDDASYRTIELPTERLKSFFAGFRVGGFDGVNVTIPHKANVVGLLDEVDSRASIINAVNCVNRIGNKLVGFNTDLLGFEYTLRHNSIDIDGGSFLILGAGGSARAVAAVLADGGARTIHLLNRTRERAESLKSFIQQINDSVSVTVFDTSLDASAAASVSCIVNTTSVGMSPHSAESPLDPTHFKDARDAVDLIYNPLQTEFLRQAQQTGLRCVNGLQMLVAQAVYSVEIWMGGNIVAHVDMNALVRELEKTIN